MIQVPVAGRQHFLTSADVTNGSTVVQNHAHHRASPTGVNTVGRPGGSSKVISNSKWKCSSKIGRLWKRCERLSKLDVGAKASYSRKVRNWALTKRVSRVCWRQGRSGSRALFHEHPIR